jgi:hypothetical protein
MHADMLRRYFEGSLTADALNVDLSTAFERTGVDTFRLRMEDLGSDFAVTSDHLVRLCDAVLEGSLAPEALRAVGFGLVASERFTWNAETDDGARVSETLHDWASPEANFALSIETAGKFKDRLLSGVDRFTREDHWKGEKRRVDSWAPVRKT